MLITWVVPHGLPVGKVEVVNIACDVLAAEGRGQKLVPAQVQSYLGKKERKKVGGRWRRRKNGVRGAGGERREEDRRTQGGLTQNGRVRVAKTGVNLDRNKGLGYLRTSLEEDV